MLQRFKKFLENKDKNINKVNIEYNLYNFNFKTIYVGYQFESLVNMSFLNFINNRDPESVHTKYGCILFYESISNMHKLNMNKDYIQALALLSYVYNFRTRNK